MNLSHREPDLRTSWSTSKSLEEANLKVRDAGAEARQDQLITAHCAL
jgi:hypothetical protein